MAEQSQDHFGTGLAFVLIATLGWSLSGLFVRLMPHLSCFQINCWRGYWLGVALLCYLVLIYGSELPNVFRRIPRTALIASALCFATGTTLYVTSLTIVNTATVSVIGATSPLVAGLLSPWVTGEKPNALTWLAAIIAVAGAVVIGYNSFETGKIAGLITSLGVPITFAVQTLLLRKHRNIDLIPAICLGGFLSFFATGFLGVVLNTGGSGFAVDLKSIAIISVMGLLQLALPLIAYAKGARYVPAVTLTLISMLDAVLNPLWPWLFVNEIPDRASLIGGGIIIAGVLLSILSGHFHTYSRRMSTR
jgi:drug/metabolite transporter, DME family